MSTKFAHSERYRNPNVRWERDDDSFAVTQTANMDSAKAFGANLRKARKERGWSQEQLAAEAGAGSKGYISDLEKGQRPIPPGATLDKLARALVVPVEQLIGPGVATERLVKIVGRVGANPDDAIIYTTASDVFDWAPVPPGGSEKSVALEVVGHSMRWVAEDGALVYFEDQRNPPAEDMLGHIVIVETADDQVLVKRLLRGSAPKLFDLESQNGQTLRDRRLRWAADITAIVPAKQARKIIKRGGVDA